MADTPQMPDARQTSAGRSRGLDELFSYPYISCLRDRRTRRVACGVSIDAGPLSHQSTNAPKPLSKLEEAVLIVSMGTTGVVMMDGPLFNKRKTGDAATELGTPFLNVAARTGSSADNCQATSFFMIHDEGIWLLRHPSGPDAVRLLTELPPRWEEWSDADWIAAAETVKVRVSDKRLEFPREYPYYLGWNAQFSNVPGTTVFLPMVNNTRQYINGLLIMTSEPDGKRTMWMDDWRQFQPHGLIEWLAWAGGKIGLSPKIPYQPIGGLKWIRNGFVNKDHPGPLGMAANMRTDYECFFYLQNIMLTAQAMGLGGWVHGSVFPPYIFHRDAAKGWHGLGFRFQDPKELSPMAPVPASQPNPVGIDGILEGHCPPYMNSMNDIVDRVVDEKYGAQGNYTVAGGFARSYRDPKSAEEYLRQAKHFSPTAIQYVKDVCNYIFDTYGRFPAHADAFYTPGIWVQVSHLEQEYYKRFFDPALVRRQAEMDGLA